MSQARTPEKHVRAGKVRVYLSGGLRDENSSVLQAVMEKLKATNSGWITERCEWVRAQEWDREEHLPSVDCPWTRGWSNSRSRTFVQAGMVDAISTSHILFAVLLSPAMLESVVEISYASALGIPSMGFVQLSGLGPETHKQQVPALDESMHGTYRLVGLLPHVSFVPMDSDGEPAVDIMLRILASLVVHYCICESPIEQAFWATWREMHDEGCVPLGLLPQYCVLNYRLDFALPDLRIAIELDGHDYHKTKEQRGRDAQRDRALQTEGWRVLRFTGSEVHADPRRCIEEVVALAKLEPQVAP